MTRPIVVALLVLLSSVGCLEHRPGSYSVDPACGASHTEVIHDVVNAYCHNADLCMGLRPYPKADLNINCSANYDDFGYSDLSVAHARYDFRHGLDGDYIIDIAMEGVAWEDLGLFWRVVAHELGHTFGLEDGSGIMGGAMSHGPAELDDSILCPLVGQCQDDEPTTMTVNEIVP